MLTNSLRQTIKDDLMPNVAVAARQDADIMELQDKVKHLNGLSLLKDRKYAELEDKIRLY